MGQRIAQHPIVTYPDTQEVSFTFDGKPYTGRAGIPIAAALMENGIRAFRDTEKRHEPRSIFCGIGQCTDCVVVVNGHPNVRSCITPLEAGMQIETQHGYGRLSFK